jgi:UDP-glucose 4-epimerase
MSAGARNAFVTGAAGFVGSNLVDRLLADGWAVTGWDNFSTGQDRFLAGASRHPSFRLVRGDTLDLPALAASMAGAEVVFHLAANADIRDGWRHPERDLQQNTVATFNVLEAMRAGGVRRIAFASTGSVYGDARVTPDAPTPETAPFPVQTSLYAASKVAGEGLVSAYAEGGHLDEAYVFRFVSLLGERYSHGHVYDFHRQLIADPARLRVLGDGRQRKSYLHVHDCLEAMLHVLDRQTAKGAPHRTQVYNLGTTEFIEVNQSVAAICRALGVNPTIEYTGGDRGWVGDSPFIFLDTAKIRATGWQPRLTIEEALLRTVQWLDSNRWIYEARR